MVTPEYNHSTSGSLKNAIDFLYAEWSNKAVGFVSYGTVGGPWTVEHGGWSRANFRWPTFAPRWFMHSGL